MGVLIEGFNVGSYKKTPEDFWKKKASMRNILHPEPCSLHLCSMKGNYNRVASYYDRLAQIVFGKAIIEAQRFLVDFIQPGNRVLVIGGGTGWILEEIAQKYPAGLEIVYIDQSEKMIARSKKRNAGANNVLFVQADLELAVLQRYFDIVFTPFVLDNFSPRNLAKVFDKIDSLLLPDSLWLFADFQLAKERPWWHRPMLKLMYGFFNIVCRVQAKQLPDTKILFSKYDYGETAANTFFHNFICSVVYQKK